MPDEDLDSKYQRYIDAGYVRDTDGNWVKSEDLQKEQDAAAPIDNTPPPQNNISDNVKAALTSARNHLGGFAGGLEAISASTPLNAAIGGASGPFSLATVPLAMLGEGLVGSWLGNQTQDLAEPVIKKDILGESDEDIKNNQLQDAKLLKENPKSAYVGELLPNALAFKTSPSVLKDAFTGSKTILQSLGNTAITDAQKAAIANIGVNAASGAANSVVGNIVNKQPIDPVEAAKQAALSGLLFNEPWLLGTHVFGFHPTPPEVLSTVPPNGVNISYGGGYDKPIGPDIPLSITGQNEINNSLNVDQPFTKASDTLLAQREQQSVADESTQRQTDFIKAQLEEYQQNKTGTKPSSNDDAEPTINDGKITDASVQTAQPFTQAKPIEEIGNNDALNKINPSINTDLLQLQKRMKGNVGNLNKAPTPVEDEEGNVVENYQPANLNNYIGAINPDGTTNIKNLGEREPDKYEHSVDLNNQLHPRAERFRYTANDGIVRWSDIPSDESKQIVENYLFKRNQQVNRHVDYTQDEDYQPPEDENYQPSKTQRTPEEQDLIDKQANKILSALPDNTPIKDLFKERLYKWQSGETQGFQPPSDEDLAKVQNQNKVTSKVVNKRAKIAPQQDNGKLPFNQIALNPDAQYIPQQNFNISKPIADYLKSKGFSVEQGNINVDPNLKTPGGVVAAGKNNSGDRSITFNPNTIESSKDTAAHETVHQAINDASSNPRTKSFIDRILTTLNGTRNNHPEMAVDKVGKIVDSNIRNGVDAPFWKTFKSNLKLKLGVGNEEDAINSLVEHTKNNEPNLKKINIPDKTLQSNPNENFQISSSEPKVNEVNPGIDQKEFDKRSLPRKIVDAANIFNYTKSDINHLRDDVKSQDGSLAANALEKQRRDALEMQGTYRDLNDTWLKLSPDKQDLLNRTGLAERRNRESYRDTLSNSLDVLDAYDKYRTTLKQMQLDQIRDGQMVREWVDDGKGDVKAEMRLPKVDEHYWPNVMSSDAREGLSKSGTLLYDKLKADFIKHQLDNSDDKKMSNNKANMIFNDVISSLGKSGSASNPTRFGGNRYAEGVGLPDSWLERDPLIANKRYLNRSTNDRSWFNNIENDPIVSRILGINRDQSGVPNPTHYDDGVTPIHDLSLNKHVQSIINQLQGNVQNDKLESWFGAARTSLLGPIGALTNHVVNTPFTMSKYAAAADLPKIVADGFLNYSKALQHTYELGWNKRDPSLMTDLSDPLIKATVDGHKIGTLIYRVNGRTALIKVGQAFAQAMGESLIKLNLNRALKGDKGQINFFENILKTGKLSDPNVVKNIQDTIPQLAKRIGEFTQGTYDYRNLPSWALSGSMSPIMQLMRWHIEQTNHFYNHVIQPASKGSLSPLINATLGSVLGGYLINELKSKLNNKKSYLPSLQEMAASSRGVDGNLSNVGYQLMAMASYSGYMGILSELGRGFLDVTHGNNPQSFNFPAWGMITDSVDRTMAAVKSLVGGDANYKDVVPKLVGDVALRNFQLARLFNTWVLEHGDNPVNKQGAQSADKSSKLRDLKVFNQVEGNKTKPNDNNTDYSNEFSDPDIRKFKNEKDINNVSGELEPILNNIMSKKDPQEIKQSLTGLKRGISYNTIPSPKANTQLTQQYLDYITKTQGKAASDALLQDYMQQQAVNKAKRSIVPIL